MSFKCVLDFQVVSCIIIIIIIALFFQSCVVSFKCVLDFNFVLFCCCCICISSVNAQAGLYDMNFTLLTFTVVVPCVYVCVSLCVRSNLPPHTLESQKRDTNRFIAIPYIMRVRIFSEFHFRSLLAFLAYLNLVNSIIIIHINVCMH